MTAIGASTWIWTSPLTDARLAELVPRIGGLGFDVIELPVEEPGQWDPGRAAELVSEHRLGASVCCVIGQGRDLSVADRGLVAETLEYLRYCVDAAARIGSGVVAGPMYAPVGRLWPMDAGERATTLGRVAEALRPLAEYAGERNVGLAVEPVNRYETSLLNTVEQGIELVDLVGSPACGLLLDTFHLNIEEKDPAAGALAAGGRIAHVHACGTDRGAPGSDRFEWPGFLQALEEAGYNGPLCIESFTPEQQTIATAAAIWRPLAASPDELAADGLRFLRELQARGGGKAA